MRTSTRLALAGLGLGAICAPHTHAADGDDSLTIRGVTLYGIVDVGLSYQSHGSPFNDEAATNVNNFLTKSSNRSNLSLASNGMSMSMVGLKGKEPIVDGWWGTFQLETGFNPASGKLIDGPGSVAQNNGVPLAKQSSYGDATRAGQALNGRATVGVDSTQFGSLTVGRNSTPLHDALCKYDPMSCSLEFSYIGFFGSAGGSGDTEDRFLDDSLKYTYVSGPLRAGALYQFGSVPGFSGQHGYAFQFDGGFTTHGLAMDALISRKTDAVLVGGPLSAAQVAALSNPSSPTFGLSSGNTVPATVSDNLSYTIMANYDGGGPYRLYAGWTHITYRNPGTPLAVGAETIGDYRIIPTNNAFPHPKELNIAWTGVKYSVTSKVDVIGAYYFVAQDSFGDTPCSDDSSAQCRGHYQAVSLVVDNRFSKHFDAYAGLQWSASYDGMNSGYLQSSSFDPMIGIRATF
jgi:predicted porin